MVVLCSPGCVTEHIGQSQPATKSERLQAHLNVARGYFQLADLQRARQAVERSLAIHHKSAEAYHLLALIQARQGDASTAMASFQRALKLASNSKIWNNYGAFLYDQKLYQKACRALARSVANEDYEGRASAFENLGHCYLQLAKTEDAKQAFHRAVLLNSAIALPRLELAAIAQQQARCAEAQQHYRAFLERSKQVPRSLLVGIMIAKSCEAEAGPGSDG